MSSSTNNTFSLYGAQGNSGMGSLQNLNRSGSSLAQLSRAAVTSQQSSTSGGPMGFNSTVGGGRVTPTSSAPPSSFNSGLFSASGGFPGGGFGGGASNNQQQLSRQLGILQQSPNSNSMSSSSAVPGRNPLFNRDRSKIGDSLSASAFDPSDFPSLGSRDNSSLPNPALARSNYVGMVKQPAMEEREFQMSNEDFPALPGVPGPNPASMASAVAGPTSAVPMDQSEVVVSSMGPPIQQLQPNLGHDPMASMSSAAVAASMAAAAAAAASIPIGGDAAQLQQQQQQLQQQRRGIQTSPTGLVTNIPNSMVTDQFGMIGLLTFIRAAETDPNLVSLALGADLTTLGLNLNSEVNLYPTFGGPWADTPCRPQDIDYHVPYEYLTNTTIRDKLAPVKLNRYKDDVLFYMFYTNVGDVLQLAAAAELYNRDWRYHKEDRVWITRAPGMPPSEKTSAYERGTYYFFDVTNWRKVPKEFHLDYDKLEDRPSLPTNLSGQHGVQAPSSSGGSPAPPLGPSGPLALQQSQLSPGTGPGLPPPPGGL